MRIVTKDEINWENDSLHEACPSITPLLVKDDINAPLVIVIPGGGYHHRAYHEGLPVAKWLNDNGYHAVLLRYSVAPIHKQEVINDGQTAIRTVRYYLKEWGISPSKIGVLGFSAGGHLAAMISNIFDEGDSKSDNPILHFSSRPDFQILCYPVISMGEVTHKGSRENLIGRNPDENIIRKYSAELQVSRKTPPAFIWTTANDASVSMLNSLYYAEALYKHQIPCNLHVFQDGKHGLGLAEDHAHTYLWKHTCVEWLHTYIRGD